jgi:Flp pilus assembly protein TadD
VAEEKRGNRWLVNSVLVVATLALLGVSAFPLVTAMTSAPPPSASPSPTAMQTPAARLEELKKQADGYGAVLQREPDNPTALRGLLEAKLGMGDVKGSIEPLERLAKLSPQETKITVLLAQAKQQTGDLEGAAQVYRDVLKGKPGNVEALGGLSALLMDQKRPEAAVSLLRDTIKEATKTNQAAPGSVDTLAVEVLLGKVLAVDKRYDEAIAAFDAAAKESPQNFQPVFYKAEVLKQQGKLDEAKPLFEKAANLAPANVKDQILKAANPDPVPSTVPSAPGTKPASPSTGAPPLIPASPEAKPDAAKPTAPEPPKKP